MSVLLCSLLHFYLFCTSCVRNLVCLKIFLVWHSISDYYVSFLKFFSIFQHYEQDADGLCTQLTKSLPKKGKQDFCVDTKAFVEAGWVIHDHELEVSLNDLETILGKQKTELL